MKDVDSEAVRRYIEAAENQYRNIKNSDYLLARPLVDFIRTPLYYYRVGILLSALEAGFHDVLDFGAGTCWLGAILYRLGSRVTFLEVSPTALKLGKKSFPLFHRGKGLLSPPRFLLYDGFDFPLADNSMDRIACHDAFHHVPNPRRILEEMYRVLRPGGRIALAEPGEGHSEKEESIEDMEKSGVLEADVNFESLRNTAREIGFNEVYFMPFPKPETMILSDEEYMAFQGGQNDVIPHDNIRRDVRYFQIIILTKNPSISDTRFPHNLRAKINLLQKPADYRAGILQLWGVQFVNVGNTTWLSPVQISQKGKIIINKGGGYVFINVLLRNNENGKIIDPQHYRIPLPKDTHAREWYDVYLEILTPGKRGKYILEFDLEASGHFMFADTHRNKDISESLKVPFETYSK